MRIQSKYFNKRVLIFLLHLTGWSAFTFYPFIFFQIRVIEPEFYYKQIINTLFLAGAFYFSTYYLFPRILKRAKLIRHLLLLFSLLIVIPLQQYSLEYFFFTKFEDHIQIISPLSKVKIAEFHSLSPRKEIRVVIAQHDSLRSNEKPDLPFPTHNIFFITETLQTSVFSVLFVLLLGGFVSVAGQLFKTEKQKKELENERLNAELAFLKSQVNPHFFFNTLNTIYLLAHKKSDQTEQVVVKLSEIMRYMIYESNAPEVSLSREIKYLEDYIDLQHLRLSKKVEVKFEVTGQPENLLIAPVLLVPFVENAFKHGVSYIDKSFIFINMEVKENSISFTTRNSLFVRKEDISESSGLGLENVKKRLNLLYPDRHTLLIERDNGEFMVNLKIILKHD